MGKASRRKNRADAANKPKRQEVPFVERPFEGIDGETDLVAMREILPMAQAPLELKDGTKVILVTLLPDNLPGLKREDGTILVAMQTRMHSGDASRDLAYAIEEAQKLDPGQPLFLKELPEPGARLQDLMASPKITIELTEDFSFWLDPAAERTPEIDEALAEASQAAIPMTAVEGATSAYWTRMGNDEFLRWIRPEDENELLKALARLQHARELDLEEGARMIGAFRACGLLVPVWELVPGTEADELATPVAALAERLEKALANTDPLTPEEKRTRDGLISRQVNLR